MTCIANDGGSPEWPIGNHRINLASRLEPPVGANKASLSPGEMYVSKTALLYDEAAADVSSYM